MLSTLLKIRLKAIRVVSKTLIKRRNSLKRTKVHSTLFLIRLKAFKGKVKGKVIRFNLIIYKVEGTPGLGLQ